jgi:hypothetical protein
VRCCTALCPLCPLRCCTLALALTLVPPPAARAHMPPPSTLPRRRLLCFPRGSGSASCGALALYLLAADVESWPKGWARAAAFNFTLVNHNDPRHSIKKGASHNESRRGQTCLASVPSQPSWAFLLLQPWRTFCSDLWVACTPGQRAAYSITSCFICRAEASHSFCREEPDWGESLGDVARVLQQELLHMPVMLPLWSLCIWSDKHEDHTPCSEAC